MLRTAGASRRAIAGGWRRIVGHAFSAFVAVAARDAAKFLAQRGRLLSSLVRPALWLFVFAAGFRNVFDVAIAPPYESHIDYQEYVLPGLLGIVLLFNGCSRRFRWCTTARWA